MNRTVSTLIPLAASLCIAPPQAYAQDAPLIAATAISSAECAGAAHLSPLQVRLVDKAAQGTVALRQFIWRTRMIYQLDTMETVAWLDRRRARLEACGQRAAHVDAEAAARH